MLGSAIVPLIGVAGVIVGGTVQYIATTITQRWKYRIEAKTEAYQNFIDVISRISIFNGYVGTKMPRELTTEEQKYRLDINMDLHSARNRPALYASPDVLRKLSKFSSAHALLKNDDDFEAYIDFIEAMRDDSFSKNYEGFRSDVDKLFLRAAMRVNN